MDIVLNTFDPLVFDNLYSKFLPMERDDWRRQYISIFTIWWSGGWIMYLIFSTISYVLLFDKSTRKDKKFLKNQEFLEIAVSLTSIPLMAFPSTFIFLAEVRGYSRLYDKVEGISGWIYLIATVILYLLFTDTCIYWIHKWLHHPLLYAPIHKLHHKWILPTPYAAYAFHPVDGFAQSMPYHMFIFVVPFQKELYMTMFLFVIGWTISIHDGAAYYGGKIINGAEHHTIHHKFFNYNYGQYFTFWDRVCGTHRLIHSDPKKQSK